MAAKVLGQVSPASATLTPLYTVDTGKQAVASSLTVCNPTSAAITFRLRVAIAGAADAAKQAVYHEVSVPANDTYTATIGLTLGPLDVVRVQASAAGVSFNLFGNESLIS